MNEKRNAPTEKRLGQDGRILTEEDALSVVGVAVLNEQEMAIDHALGARSAVGGELGDRGRLRECELVADIDEGVIDVNTGGVNRSPWVAIDGDGDVFAYDVVVT